MQASGWSIITQTGLSGKKSSQIKKKINYRENIIELL